LSEITDNEFTPKIYDIILPTEAFVEINSQRLREELKGMPQGNNFAKIYKYVTQNQSQTSSAESLGKKLDDLTIQGAETSESDEKIKERGSKESLDSENRNAHDLKINFDELDFLCVVMELGQFVLKDLFQ